MDRRRMKYLVPLLFLFFFSCGPEEKKFDPSTWNNRNDFSYTNREKMVNDLMENHLHEGMHFREVMELTGPPENYANLKPNTIGYEIMVDYGRDIDPVEGKILYLEFSPDSALVDYQLEHWIH